MNKNLVYYVKINLSMNQKEKNKIYTILYFYTILIFQYEGVCIKLESTIVDSCCGLVPY